MKKIISVYKRDYDGNHLVYDEVVEGAEWVLVGEGVATRKWDGTAVLIHEGGLWKRYTLKPGRDEPVGFEPASNVDETTGKREGWVPVGDGPEDKYHREAFAADSYQDGTYELVGPKIQGNAESQGTHSLIQHGVTVLPVVPRAFDELRDALDGGGIEGIVWHHPDGRMVKIKARDFGVKR